MATPTLTDVVSGPAAAIGRYFSVLSVVPSALFTAYTFLLLSSGIFSGQADWAGAGRSVRDLGLGGVAVLGLASLLVGLILQPLQYSLVQFLEGYWGVGRLAQLGRQRRLLHHRRTFQALARMEFAALWRLEQVGQSPADHTHAAVSEDNLETLSLYEEAARVRGNYPARVSDIRPTRLGNVLRRYESKVGFAYGLPGVSVVPHLTIVAPERDVAYYDDQRTQMDLAVRLSVLSAMATVVTVALTWRAGLWLLLALPCYTLTYVFYRGAVAQAHGFGTALMTLVDLNRLALYDRLGMPRPDSTHTERLTNVALGAVIRDSSPAYLRLKSEASPGAPPL